MSHSTAVTCSVRCSFYRLTNFNGHIILLLHAVCDAIFIALLNFKGAILSLSYFYLLYFFIEAAIIIQVLGTFQ